MGHVSEHFYGSGEVVDGNAAHHGIEGLVGERQTGLGVEVVDNGHPGRGVCGELVRVHPEHSEVCWRSAEVRDPRTHQIEHVAGDPKVVVESTDRRDGLIVEMSDQARRRVEPRISGPVSPVEETGREGVTLHPFSLSRSRRLARRTAQARAPFPFGLPVEADDVGAGCSASSPSVPRTEIRPADDGVPSPGTSRHLHRRRVVGSPSRT